MPLFLCQDVEQKMLEAKLTRVLGPGARGVA